VWQWAARNLSAPGTSRAACYLLEAVFNARLLDAIATTETVDATLFSESLSGFCGLSDSSLSLWRTVLMSRLSDNPASADKIATRTVNWLAANWNMRKLSGDLVGCPLLTLHSLCSRQIAKCANRIPCSARHPHRTFDNLYRKDTPISRRDTKPDNKQNLSCLLSHKPRRGAY
jgi:hypothetical protein